MFKKVSKKLPLDLQVYFITVNASEGGEGGGWNVTDLSLK